LSDVDTDVLKELMAESVNVMKKQG
jgi:hypothetical protein